MTNQPKQPQFYFPFPREVTPKRRNHSFQKKKESAYTNSFGALGIKWPRLNQSRATETYTKAECMRCADDVIPAGSVASTASSSGGLSHGVRQACWATTVLECCVPSVRNRPLRSTVLPTAIIRCINEWVPLLYTESRWKIAQEHPTQGAL